MTDDTTKIAEKIVAPPKYRCRCGLTNPGSCEVRGCYWAPESVRPPTSKEVKLARGYLDLRRRLAEAETRAERVAKALAHDTETLYWLYTSLNTVLAGNPHRAIGEVRAAAESAMERSRAALAETAGEETSDE